MEREDLLHFARRDRRAVEQSRAAHWRGVALAAGGTATLLAVADGLRLDLKSRFPGWPDETERAADLGCHVRVAEALSRVRSADAD